MAEFEKQPLVSNQQVEAHGVYSAASAFPYDVAQLQSIVRTRKLDEFKKNFQSVDNLVEKMKSHPVHGLSSSEIQMRKEAFGINKIEPPPPTPFWRLMLDALNDTTMIILIIASVVSMILTTTVIKPKELEWIDSVAILVAVVVVVMVTSCNDYSKEKQFRALNAQKDDKTMKVIRNGSQQEISVYEVVVGDIVVLGVGDQIAADGILIASNDMKVDESGMTGESDEIKKSVEKNPFLIGSCLVTGGSGLFIVTAVGKNSIYGDILLTLQENDEETPLQAKLDELAKIIGYVGIGSASMTFLVLIIEFFFKQDFHKAENYVIWVNYFILAITIIVVAVPEGLPLAVTISLAYSMKQMIKDQCLVRKLESCETMGSVSNICTDKTGTLTLNQMRVVRARFGKTSFIQQGTTPLGKDVKEKVNEDTRKYYNLISSVCSTAEIKPDSSGKRVVVGNKTEGGMLLLSEEMGCDYVTYRKALVVGNQPEGAIHHKFDFSSERKRMSVVLKGKEFSTNSGIKLDDKLYVLAKGASEMMLDKCTKIQLEDGSIVPLTSQDKTQIEKEILTFAEASLRTLILAYKEADMNTSLEADALESELILSALVGIQDPLRPAVKQAVADCHHASITVRMVTGDNIITAVAISKDAGILPQGLNVDQAIAEKRAITGPEFAKLTDQEVDAMLPTLVCMARSAPKDKYRLVCRLKANNMVVAATGDGSNDAPQLKAANVGLAMGIAGTEVAKEASDMIIMNDAFDTIVKAIAWGRTVTANVRKFLQFQLSVNVVALLIAFLGAAVVEESPLTSIQLLYVNLIMDSLGSLALATEGPAKNVLDCPPIHRSASIIAPGMLRNVIISGAYQIIVILCMMFEGACGNGFTVVPDSLYPVGLVDAETIKHFKELRQTYRYTVVYNFFIMVQIFNEFNSRRLNNEVNIFEGITKNFMFCGVIISTAVFQVIIMLVPGIRDVFGVYSCGPSALKPCKILTAPNSISGASWAVSICMAAGIMIVHLLGRAFIKTDKEFPVSEKRVAKDMEKIRKREQAQREKEEEELINRKKNFTDVAK
ncbi:Calcium-transporting_ATPase [Hexamita inflata]|uniref:Calcium-transporting ATPase n=1 Tax=Hexamita inflata TaxID=28002 RepID=A0AA86UTF0_9EUKA|nr:Calcium-transporting ATPase [Hexamita inflata]